MSETQVKAEQQTKEEIEGKLGSLLKSYREQSGHDIYEVAEALCLSPAIIQALEDEDFERLPEPPYIRGYLRSYAKFAEIDSQEVIELYEAQRGADPQDLEYHFKPNNDNLAKPPISATTLRLGLIALLLIALAGLSMIPAVNSWIGETWAGFSKQTAQKNYNNASHNEDVLAANQIEKPAPLPGDEAEKPPKDSGAATKKSDDKKADSAALSDTSSKQTKDTSLDKDQKDNPDSTDEKNTTEVEANKETEDNEKNIKEDEEGTKLKFVFKKEVWMRIRDNNRKIVFESLSPAGSEKELRLKTPLTFRIGNAQGIEIYVEGTRLDITKSMTGSVATFKIE